MEADMEIKNRYTRQQLVDMPITFLRHLDIETKDEEMLVQEVLNERLKNAPSVVPPRSLPAYMTDRVETKEDEERLQKIVDERHTRERAQALVAGMNIEDDEELFVPAEEEDVTAPPASELAPMAIVEEVIEEIPTVAIEKAIEGKPRFCNYCDAVKSFHRKGCTRPRA